MKPREAVTAAIEAATRDGRPAVVAFLTGGFPDRARFAKAFQEVASAADVVEVGVPFTDPMADGTTIQRSSRQALEAGTTLRWILDELARIAPRASPPVLLMSYLNPLLAFGFDTLPAAAVRAGVAGFIIPDLPFEESAAIRAALDTAGLALVQLVTPVTPPERLARLCAASQGFVYAVTMTGTTGKQVAVPPEVIEYLDRVKKVSPLPVCAGFGIRARAQVALMTGHVDGVVVGSALVEVIEREEDPAEFLRGLRGAGRSET